MWIRSVSSAHSSRSATSRNLVTASQSRHSLTPLPSGRNGPIEISIEQLAAIERSKSCLAQVTTLAFPSPDAQLSLMVDVSKTEIGAVLNQEEGDHRQPLAFFQKPCTLPSSHTVLLDESCLRPVLVSKTSVITQKVAAYLFSRTTSL